MFEQIVLGLVQGVAEWLPISSEGAILAVKNTFFADGETLSELIKLALFLHLGTFLAALIYFRKDVWQLLKKLKEPGVDNDRSKILIFLVISTLISGMMGFFLFQIIEQFEDILKSGSKYINILIALMLFLTAFIQSRAEKGGLKKEENISWFDSLILGIVQGLAVIPGLSRSGLTVSTLLLRKFDDQLALKLSFLMSLPIVLAGNIFLNLNTLFSISLTHLAALISSFVAGLATIDILLRVAKKINFAYFTAFFGLLMIISVFF